MSNPIFNILLNLGTTVQRFTPSFDNRQDFEALLFRYGWNVDLGETALEAFSNMKDLLEAFVKFSEKLEEWIGNEEDLESEESDNEENEDKDWKDYLKELFPLAKNIYKSILELKELNDIEGSLFAPFDQPDFWEDIGEKLIEDIFVLTIQRHYPIAYACLHSFGIIEYSEEEPSGDLRVNYTKTDIEWGRLVKFLNSPVELFKEVYDWDNAQGYNWEKLLHNLERSFLSNRFMARYILPRKSVVDAFGMDQDYVFDNKLYELQIPLIYGTSILDESFYNIGIGLMPTTSNVNRNPDGLLITPVLQGGLSNQFLLAPDISLDLDLDVNANNLVAAEVFPGRVNFPTNIPNGRLAFNLKGTPYKPWVILGDAESHRLELHGFQLGMVIQAKEQDPEVTLLLKATSDAPDTRGIRALINLDEADSFIADTAGSSRDKIEAEFDLEIEWSSKKGFRFAGNANLDFQMQLNQKLGFLEITNLYLAIQAGNTDNVNGLQLQTGLGLRGELGPIQFFVENTGFAFDLLPTDAANVNKENAPALGMLDFDLSYAPPKGVGILIDAPYAKGGGYLEFNRQKGQYLGAAELTIIDKFTVKAIGVINTKLPDGQKGYSFLLMITTEFNPVQLGFGFTLSGVGGLIGVHRSLNIEAIRKKVQGPTFEELLFPPDPIANVHSIVASLDTILPIQKGQYSFGIMGKLGWGSPTLIDIKLGLLFQAPDFNIALVGTAKTELVRASSVEDEPDKVLYRIQISFAAWYQAEKSLFGFDASLFQSEILGLPLSGDAALRLRGGSDPYFMVSVGGFHPEFQIPKGLGLGDMNRLSLGLDSDLADLNISAKFYAAITSNTVQFGFEASAGYSVFGLGFSGKIGFNALFQFRPVYFIVDAFGELTIHVWGGSWTLRLWGRVEGPYPFKFALGVSIPILWWDVDFELPEFTIGSDAEEEKPTIDVLEELRIALEDNRNWNPVLPKQTNLLVTLRRKEEALPAEPSSDQREQDLIFHPLGGLKIDQDRVPLNVLLDKFGHNKPEKHNLFGIHVKNANQKTLPVNTLRRSFAPAQFFEMKKEEKLSSASFEKMDSGINIQEFNQISTGKTLQKEVLFDTRYWDSQQETSAQSGNGISELDFDKWTNRSAIATSAIGKKQTFNQQLTSDIGTTDEEFLIVAQDDSINFTPVRTGSEAMANQILKQMLKEQPELEEELVVVPAFEMV